MSIFSPVNSNARPLGDDAATPAVPSASYPWLAYSDATKALQIATNAALSAAGYCPIATDGKLGPATCGARNALTADDKTGAIWSNPPTCSSFTSPKKSSDPGGCGAGAVTSSSTVSSAPKPPTSASSSPLVMPVQAGMSTNTKLLLGAGLLVAGGLYFMKRRG